MHKKFFITLILLTFSLIANSATFEYEYNFNYPTVNHTANNYQTINFRDCIQAGIPGHPSFPVKGVSILLPPGEEAVDVTITAKGKVWLGEDYEIQPRQYPRPFSAENSIDFVKNESVYQQNETLSYLNPEFSTQWANGHSILLASFSPMTYNPANSDVHYYQTVILTVETESTTSAQNALSKLKTTKNIQNKIKRIVDNPKDIALYPMEQRNDNENYEYLIITPPDYEENLSDFVNFYNRRGIRTQIFNTDYISENYQGSDLQEKMRSFVIEEYEAHAIEYLLLAGDTDAANAYQYLVPHRGFYTAVNSPHGSNDWITDNDIPADLYYSGLDGNWNDDGDSKWGEENEDDLFPEIAVGRVCVDNDDEVETFITKSTAYQENPVIDDVTKSLMLGEFLYGDPYETWGSDMLVELIDFCDANGYETYGIPSDIFEISEKYEKELGSYTSWDVIDWINSGTHLINHNGHANVHYGMKLDQWQVTNNYFNNCNGVDHGYVLPITQGCLSGSIDNRGSSEWYDDEDCIAEQWVSIDNFAVATYANSRYGWFVEGSTDGPGQHLHRELLDAFFGEDITHLGTALSRAKEETAPYVELPDQWEDGALRWNFYCMNLLGDPALDLWTDTPANFENVEFPQTINPETETIQVETGVDGALAAISYEGTLYGRAYADEGGTAIITLTEEITDGQTLELVITAHNYLVYENVITVANTNIIHDNIDLDVPNFRLNRNYPNPFNPSTTISFTLPEQTAVELAVYDLEGNLVKTLISDIKSSGYHAEKWNGTDNDGKTVGSGMYIYRIETDSGFSQSNKMLLLK